MIDWNRVGELRDEVGEDDFAEVLEIFLEEVEEVIDRLRIGPNPNQFENDLHFLKGSALNLGFAHLGEACQNGEIAAASTPAPDIDNAPIILAYDNSKREFLAHYKSHA